MIALKRTLFLAAAALAGCTYTETDLGDGTFRAEYSAPFEGNVHLSTSIAIRVEKKCPYGYEKLREFLEKKRDGKPTTYVWIAKCLTPDANKKSSD